MSFEPNLFDDPKDDSDISSSAIMNADECDNNFEPLIVVRRHCYTLIDLLAAIFVLAVPLVGYLAVEPRVGPLAGIGAGLLAGAVALTIVVAWYRRSKRRFIQHLKELTGKYPDLYRVVALPTETGDIVKADDAEIVVGDYGWEAEPIRDDGRTYLQGLTKNWSVAWYAGFRPDQIEKIGPKPHSQYYQRHPSPGFERSEAYLCPYPVQSGETIGLGEPLPIIGPFVQGRRVD